MKLLQKHYLFILVIALLSLLLGISIVNDADRTRGATEQHMQFTAHINTNSMSSKNEDYQNTIIYGAYPFVYLSVMSNNYPFFYEIVSAKYNSSFHGLVAEFKSGYYQFEYPLYCQVAYRLGEEKPTNHNPYEYYDISTVTLDMYDSNTRVEDTTLIARDNEDIHGHFLGFPCGTSFSITMTVVPKSGCTAEFYQQQVMGAPYQQINALNDEKYGYEVESELDPYCYIPYGYRFIGWTAETPVNQGTAKEGIIEDVNPKTRTARIYKKPGETSKFYATYAQNYYTINFDYNYPGTFVLSSDPLASAIEYKISDIFSNTPTRTGYTFAGWNTRADGKGTTYYQTSRIAQDVDHGTVLTLYAQWTRNTYKIKYYDDDGITVLRTDTCTYDVSKTLLNPTKTGHYFLGWKLDNNATTINYSGGQSVINLTSTNGAVINLYAHWKKEKYRITYTDTHTGFPTSSVEVFYGDTLKIPIPTKNNGLVAYDLIGTNDHWLTGHYLQYWNCTKDNKIYYANTITVPDWGNYANKDQEVIEVGFNAVWELETYYVDFFDHEKLPCDDGVVKYGETISIDVPTRTGYIFDGWNTKSDGTGTTYNDTFTADIDYGLNYSYISLYQQWTPITYTVVFDKNSSANDVTGTINNIQNKKYDEEFTLPNNTYVRNNGKWLFTGWATTSTGAVAYTNGQTVKNLTTTNNATVRLYAVWRDTWANHTIQPVLKNKNNANSKDNPYLIQSAGNLAWMSSYLYSNNSALSGWYLQTANINLSSYEWLPIGYDNTHVFTGNYDGNGFSIANISVSEVTGVERNNLGLFGYTYGAQIEKVRLASGNIGNSTKHNSYVGGVVGQAENSTISNCINFTTIKSKSTVGGIVGKSTGQTNITGCQNYGNTTGSTSVAGIVGSDQGTLVIKNCYSKSSVSASFLSGGIISSFTGTELIISSCAFEGELKGFFSKSMLVGTGSETATVTITNCFVNAASSHMTINKENDYGLSYKKGLATNCVSVINSQKRYIGSDFSNWVISPNGTPMPSGLTWLGTGGVKATLKDIQDYVKS